MSDNNGASDDRNVEEFATAEDDANLVPDTTVRFDRWAGCGVNVTLSADGTGEFVELAFVSKRGTVEAHYLTFGPRGEILVADTVRPALHKYVKR